MKRASRTMHRFFCTNCGREGLPLARKTSHQHQKGHLKNLYFLGVKLSITTGNVMMTKK